MAARASPKPVQGKGPKANAPLEDTKEKRPGAPARAEEAPAAGVDKKVIQKVALDAGAADSLFDDLKVVPLENLALNNLAAELEEVDIRDLLRECLSVARLLRGDSDYQPGAPVATADGESAAVVPLNAGEEHRLEPTDEEQALKRAEEKRRQADDLLERGLLEEAQSCYAKALQFHPEDEAAKGRLDQLLGVQRMLSEAQASLGQHYPSLLEEGRGILSARQQLAQAKATLPALEQSAQAREMALAVQAATERMLERILEAAGKLSSELGQAKEVGAAGALCDSAAALLEVARDLDASHPKVTTAMADITDRRSSLAAAQEPLAKAARLIEENTYEGLREAARLLDQAQAAFPQEPTTKLLWARIRERYLERAEEALGCRDWKAARLWVTEANQEAFTLLPGHERSAALQKRLKAAQWRGRAFRLLAAAVPLGLALLATAALLLNQDAQRLGSGLLQSLPLLASLAGGAESAAGPGPASEAPGPSFSPTEASLAKEPTPMSPAPVNPNPGCIFDPSYGHNVCDDAEAPFRSFWGKNQLVLGPPISERRVESGLTVQYFENARLEFHPGNPAPYQVLPGLLGYLKDPSLEEYKAAFAPQPEGRADKMAEGAQFPDATKHYLGNQHGFRDFWAANGGLDIFGSPISEEFLYAPTGRYRQHFERAVFEHNGEAPPVVRLVPLGIKYAQSKGWAP